MAAIRTKITIKRLGFLGLGRLLKGFRFSSGVCWGETICIASGSIILVCIMLVVHASKRW